MPDLVAPGDPRYDLSRSQFTGRPREVLPRLVARCAGPDDVRGALALARSRGWPFAVRGGGHGNAGHSATSGLLIDLAPADAVAPARDRVTIGAGVRVGRLAEALAPLGRLVPLGSCPSVGVVGAALGGGFGSHGRLHGLTCDALVSAEVVLASGELVVASADEHPDLFWALRGAGGGNFGVVTTAVFRTAPARPRTHLRVTFDFAHAARLVHWWQRRAPDAPDDVSVELVLLVPDHPDEEPTALLVGAAPEVGDLLDGLPDPVGAEVVALSSTDAALLHATPYSAVARDPVDIPLVSDRPGMSTAKTGFFDRPLPDDEVAALLAHLTAGRRFGELRELAFTPWRGAYGRVAPDATAFAHRSPAFLLKHTVLVGPNGAERRGDEVLRWLADAWSLVHPDGTGPVYPNFPDPALADWLTAYYGTGVDRLRAVKARYDPEGVFTFAQSIPPARAGRTRQGLARREPRDPPGTA
ncbi:FAD/FMN-containing dehydrogenase [Saccharothrix longispora]|uniref:FAD/FMN-containing dehydrogenase n=1 Tax=Saccharothrix longispora TaxID=33920 RepID=A0ABU1PR94_9PSEU|nr:FAD-binding oxidoreductase [Saccharothrix longispora]MDR6593176.1 FAD/FMN-containing dehydrogenase [Saccharothrix longispora]